MRPTQQWLGAGLLQFFVIDRDNDKEVDLGSSKKKKCFAANHSAATFNRLVISITQW